MSAAFGQRAHSKHNHPGRGPIHCSFGVIPAHRVRGYYYWESLPSQMGEYPPLPKKPILSEAGTFSTSHATITTEQHQLHRFTQKQRRDAAIR